MSRYTESVSKKVAYQVFGLALPKKDLRLFELIEAGDPKVKPSDMPKVQVSHGYDGPCYAYFCDLEPDCEIGIYYGIIGLTKQLDRFAYRDAMQLLGLTTAVNAVEMDLPY